MGGDRWGWPWLAVARGARAGAAVDAVTWRLVWFV
jgi:hypothetical protein